MSIARFENVLSKKKVILFVSCKQKRLAKLMQFLIFKINQSFLKMKTRTSFCIAQFQDPMIIHTVTRKIQQCFIDVFWWLIRGPSLLASLRYYYKLLLCIAKGLDRYSCQRIQGWSREVWKVLLAMYLF